ncbi:TraX family protein [uncultured Peptoniphilus sp.]|uniref:TraX family protein n=1 Tax=uncultured Peptoniphilus sp. TaxID=254354 RepID=UPI00259A49E5|nr:TraX family protein [uncultured Peptoniphilus sp.]
MNKRFTNEKLMKFQILNGAQLKYIAFGSMLIDHINKALIWPNIEVGYSSILSSIFDVIGRIAFSLFSFFIVEGFFRTRSKKKYFLNLLIFALISEIPYDMFSSKVILEFRLNNVLFSLALSLITIWILDEFRKRYEDKLGKFWIIISVPLLIIMFFVSTFVSGDYDFHAIMTAFVFYIFYEKPVASAICAYLTIVKEVWSILGFGLTVMYNGKKGKQNKIFNYLFYPVHLLILGLLRFYFNI